MSALEMLFYKIRNSLDSNISDSAIGRIVNECYFRTQHLGIDIKDLLDDNVSISLNKESNEIDMRQNALFGIFWSFDVETGELVGT